MMRYGNITKEDAKRLGIGNLSARIWSLRSLGCNITTVEEGYRLKSATPNTTYSLFKPEELLFNFNEME